MSSRRRTLFAHRAPYVIDVLVMHYGEEPSADIGARLPQMSLGDPAHERVLHEIVSPIAVARECPRIAAESRDFMFEEAMKFGHPGDSRRCEHCGWLRPYAPNVILQCTLPQAVVKNCNGT